MIRAVYDTNTLASVAIAKTGSLARLAEAWSDGTVQVIVSQHILRELETTLSKPYFVAQLRPDTRERFLISARTTTTIVAITALVPQIARTRADNLVLATAESAGASYLVTGDRELQAMGKYKAVSTVSPRQFLNVLELDHPLLS